MTAIQHKDGPALVVAGPGSGKTSVLCGRIKWLIDGGCAPGRILVITFSRAAAENMQIRFKKYTNSSFDVCFSTFHSFFFSILRDCYHYTTDNIADILIKRKILRQILSNFTINASNELIDALIKRISLYKNSVMTRDFLDDTNIDTKTFIKIFEEYNTSMHSYDKIDFDDMVTYCLNVLQNNQIIRNRYINKYDYILVDEYQDINGMQQAIVDLLLNESKNLFCVGDDDQSIYSFRGSDPGIMVSFTNRYESAKIYYLNCNYRSTKDIVELSSTLIRENSNRIDKNLYSDMKVDSQVVINGFRDSFLQNSYIISQLKKIIAKKENAAVLYRTNREYLGLLIHLKKENLKCNLSEPVTNIFESQPFTDFMHYIKMAHGDKIELDDFIAVMNKPVRYLSRKSIVGTDIDLKNLMKTQEKDYVVRNLKKMQKDLEMIKKMDMFSAFNFFRYGIGYEEYLITGKQYNKALMDELQDLMRLFHGAEEILEYMGSFEREYSSKKNNLDCNINIMTYHSSKGMEFDNVIIPDLNEGRVPSSKAVEACQLEEERRMLYVAMTRAKKNLYMTFVNGDENRLKSRFLYVFDKKC